MKEFVMFKLFITPYTLQFLFWSGIGACIYGSWWLYTHDNWAWVMSITFGPLVTRQIFEGLMLKYQSFIYLKEIRDKLYEEV